MVKIKVLILEKELKIFTLKNRIIFKGINYSNLDLMKLDIENISIFLNVKK